MTTGEVLDVLAHGEVAPHAGAQVGTAEGRVHHPSEDARVTAPYAPQPSFSDDAAVRHFLEWPRTTARRNGRAIPMHHDYAKKSLAPVPALSLLRPKVELVPTALLPVGARRGHPLGRL